MPAGARTGVYCIRNKINGKAYVGSAATSIRQRWAIHRSSLLHGRHHSIHLQRAYSTHGASALEFFVICTCSPEWCLTLEQFHINRLKSFDRSFGYNINPTAGSRLGCKMTEGQRLANSVRQKGRKLSPEVYAAMVLERRSRPKTAALMAAAKRLTSDPEIVARCNEAKRRYWQNPNPEHVAKLDEWRKSQRLRDAVRAAMTGRKFSEEHRRKIGDANRNRQLSEETRAKMKASARLRASDPAQRERLREIAEKGREARAKNLMLHGNH